MSITARQIERRLRQHRDRLERLTHRTPNAVAALRARIASIWLRRQSYQVHGLNREIVFWKHLALKLLDILWKMHLTEKL